MKVTTKVFLVLFDYAKSHNDPDVAYIIAKILFAFFLGIPAMIVHSILISLSVLDKNTLSPDVKYASILLGVLYFIASKFLPTFEEVENIDIKEAIPNKFLVWACLFLYLIMAFVLLLKTRP